MKSFLDLSFCVEVHRTLPNTDGDYDMHFDMKTHTPTGNVILCNDNIVCPYASRKDWMDFFTASLVV